MRIIRTAAVVVTMLETDGGAGGCTPRGGQVGPRKNPGPYFLSPLPHPAREEAQ
jgi:hypothetical protein